MYLKSSIGSIYLGLIAISNNVIRSKGFTDISFSIAQSQGRQRKSQAFSRELLLSKNSELEDLYDGDNRFENKLSIMEDQTMSQDQSRSFKIEKEESKNLPGAQMLEDMLAIPLFEVFFAGLVLISSLLVAIGTVASVPSDIKHVFANVEDIISFVFVVEFFIRWYSNDLNAGHLLKPFTIIDLLVISPNIIPYLPTSLAAFIPSVLSSSSGVINLRLFRILRFQRVLIDLETFKQFEIALGIKPTDVRSYQLQLARVLISIFTLLSISTGLIYTAEYKANPEGFPDYFTALYFGLTTLTTVGFGDITPITFQGRLVVMGSILAGVAIIPVQAAALFEALLDYQNEREITRNNEKNDNIKSKSKNKKDPSITKSLQDGDKKKEKQIKSEYRNDVELVPPITANKAQRSSEDIDNRMLPVSFVVDEPCTKCNATPHRLDARFCWSCGHQLQSNKSKSSNNTSSSFYQ